jgi:hypothetical protein
MSNLAVDSVTSAVTAPPSALGHRLKGIAHALLSFPVFLGAMVSAAAITLTAWENAPIVGGKLFVEGDTWWHIEVGKRILSTHRWPITDSYSFTVHGAPWIAYEWLGEAVMAIADRLGGLQGLAALLVLLAVTIAVLIYYYSWLRTGNYLGAAAATLLVLPLAAISFTMRPQMIGYSFLLITLICLERFQQGRSKSLWLLPVVFLIWVNTHGSFVLGFLALALYWGAGLVQFRFCSLAAERWTPTQRRHLLFISLLCLVAVMITPYGTALATYPLAMVAHQPLGMLFTIEFQPLQFSEDYARVFLALLLGALLIQVISPIVYRLEILLLLLFAIAESCLHARFLTVFAIVFAPVLATPFARWLPHYRKAEDHPLANAILVSAVALGVIVFFPSREKLQRKLSLNYPVGAVQFLRQHPIPERMFSDTLWGSYLIRALPQRQVFIDGRSDIYEYSGVTWDYYNFITLHGAPGLFLEKYDLRAALIQRGTAIDSYFRALGGWQTEYQDSNSIIFVRSSSATEAQAIDRSPKLERRNYCQ